MKQRMTKRVANLVSPAVAQMREKARQREAAGAELIYLMRGEPDLATPDHIRRAADEALRAGYTHYAPTNGIPELRQAVSNRMLRDFGIEFDPEREVVITTGATMGIYIAVQAVIDPGDEVILFDPIYDPYQTVIRLAGGKPISVAAQEQDGHFTFSIDSLEAALSQQTKALLLNNPWNPTGSVMTHQELRALVDLAETYDLVLIADEIYEKIVFDGLEHLHLASISEAARTRTITINSFSKTYAMTGWRLGYNLAPPDLTEAMVKVAQQFSRSAATFIQHAGVAALERSQEKAAQMVEIFARRRALVTDLLHEHGFGGFHPPQGTFFVFMDVRDFGQDSQSIADYLLESAGVVTIPGDVYGPAGQGYIRLSFAYPEHSLKQGVAAIAGALAQL